MSNCCVPNDPKPAPMITACPANGTPSKQVDSLTVKSLVRKLPLGTPCTLYYFCEAPDCDVVYFALDRKAPRFTREDLRVRVGAKETREPIPICYCFDFSRQDILDEILSTGKSTVGKRIAEQIRAGNCACEVKNPSGKCCLGAVVTATEVGLKAPQSK